MKNRLLGGLALWLALASPVIGASAASTEATLLTFAGGNGAFPNAALVAGKSGVLYGVSVGGGPQPDFASAGVAFSLTPSAEGSGWTQTILHVFGQASMDGSSPHGRLLPDASGSLYGTTYGGGNADQGTVYKLTPPTTPGGTWQEQVLYRFTGAADGANPLGEVIFDPYGRLYGTSSIGGAGGQGIVYRLSPPASGSGPWTLKVLHSFTGPDGAAPHAGLILRTFAGLPTLFGTTSMGGASRQGAVFAMTAGPGDAAPWSYAIVHSFTGAADGGGPQSELVADHALNLYGTTTLGGAAPVGTPGGVVFKLIPPGPGATTWTDLVLHSFAGGADGQFSLGAPLLESGGHLFGTSGGSTYGGCTVNCGTVFMLTSTNGGQSGPWNELVLHNFSGTDGALPSAGLAAVLGTGGTLSLYGVTERGGAANDGTVFQVTP